MNQLQSLAFLKLVNVEINIHTNFGKTTIIIDDPMNVCLNPMNLLNLCQSYVIVVHDSLYWCFSLFEIIRLIKALYRSIQILNIKNRFIRCVLIDRFISLHGSYCEVQGTGKTINDDEQCGNYLKIGSPQ